VVKIVLVLFRVFVVRKYLRLLRRFAPCNDTS